MFFEISAKAQTAIQVKSWIDSCTSSMTYAKKSFDDIVNFRETIESNPDYTAEDKAEIDAELARLNLLAQSLI